MTNKDVDSNVVAAEALLGREPSHVTMSEAYNCIRSLLESISHLRENPGEAEIKFLKEVRSTLTNIENDG